MKLKQIKTVEKLFTLKSVYWTVLKKRMPVAFIGNWQAWRINWMVKNGQLFEVVKK